jgi:class 3 adenylate cyclase/tetratricopeptide (TPR) repeat protein
MVAAGRRCQADALVITSVASVTRGGQPMTERAAERRVVTALFVDLAGSTALTVALGAERVKRSLDRAFADLTAIIVAEGGVVEKYIGDAIHALFGVPLTHPDDPQRAVRAAYACVQWADAQRRDPSSLAVRVGVETGEAVVDMGAAETEHQRMSVGACINVAARLQQLAEPGTVLVGPACHEANVEMGEFVSLGDVELKGLGRVPAWRLAGLAPLRRPTRLPLVGRAAELELLGVASRRARSGRGVLVLVSGPPGQGKTRVVQEFVDAVAAESCVLYARCRPAGEAGAWNLLRALLAAAGHAGSLERLEADVAARFLAPEERRRVLGALTHSAGIRITPELTSLGPTEREDEIADGWRRYLAALSTEKPVLIWIEDVHWAEGEHVRLLDRISTSGAGPLLVVATARPEFAARAGLRPGGDRFFIELDALDAVTACELAQSAGAPADVDVARAEGNPLFILELARSRATDANRTMPLTLRGMIGARLDELPRPDRELVQRVALLGETISVRAAAGLAGRDVGDISPALARLADLLYLDRVPEGYRFHHALVREVAFGRLPAAERLALHARFASAEGAGEDPEARAHHWWEALGSPDADWVWEGRAELPALRARALDAHLAAGRRYTDRFAHERAVDIYTRARRFTTGFDEAARVERAIGDAFGTNGGADDAWDHYLRAHALHRQAASYPPAAMYPDLVELAIYHEGMFRRPPDPVVVEALLGEGQLVARDTGDAAAEARLLAAQSFASGDLQPLREALRLLAAAADPMPFVPFLRRAATLQIKAGAFLDAEQTLHQLEALAAQSGRGDWRPSLETRTLAALSIGNLREAEETARALVAASAAWGPHLRTHAYRGWCHVVLARGDWRGLCDLAADVQHLVADHPDTPLCYAVTTTTAFAAVAHAVEARWADAGALLTRAELPLQAEPFEREAVLLLAYGALGRRRDVERLIRNAEAHRMPIPWHFRRMEAIALTMLQDWDALESALAPLETAAAGGSRYLEALVAAIREEREAARHGAAPEHVGLRDLGYLGWSQLLAHRPPSD